MISFRKILIANRGEIAVRIMRACREMGIASVAVYSEADREALHVWMADEALLIGPAPAPLSYLNGEAIIAAAKQTGCEAIHPGYGFLAENADFAQAVADAGLTFIGPPPSAIRAMGSKTAARALMQAAGVPTVPGYQRDRLTAERAEDAEDNRNRPSAPRILSRSKGASSAVSDDDQDFFTAAERLGYPVMVKAAAGGGGKGMRTVPSAAGLADALESARREAANAFGNAGVYLEKALAAPHHVEFQVLADRHGHTIHLRERECSIQRRHQKIIEETPSPRLDDDLRARMGAAAVAAASAVGYVNAGTVEFLVDADRNFYFLEMNTRLQVEHPITEAVTGLDLVKAQIRIAAGEPLALRQDDVRGRGHAIECRVYAEDPVNGFLPATGVILLAEEPRGPGVRVDSGFGAGREVSRFYDPLIAKVIAHAESRAEAITRMERALSEYVILGVTTNILFLRDVLAAETFRRGEAATDWVDRQFAHWSPPAAPVPDEVLVAAALSEAQTPAPAATDSDGFSPWQATDGFRLGSGGA